MVGPGQVTSSSQAVRACGAARGDRSPASRAPSSTARAPHRCSPSARAAGPRRGCAHATFCATTKAIHLDHGQAAAGRDLLHRRPLLLLVDEPVDERGKLVSEQQAQCLAAALAVE
eukprot:6619330-Prymnesium_polylepis.1